MRVCDTAIVVHRIARDKANSVVRQRRACMIKSMNGLRSETARVVREFRVLGLDSASEHSVNRTTTVVVPPIAARCAKAPDCEFDPISVGPIDDQGDAVVSGSNPGLDVSKRQEKGKVEN